MYYFGYLWCWVCGNNICKLQEFFVEKSYTTSIMTLVTINYQRLKATTDSFSTRARGWFNREYLKPVIILGSSLLVLHSFAAKLRRKNGGRQRCLYNYERWVHCPADLLQFAYNTIICGFTTLSISIVFRFGTSYVKKGLRMLIVRL